MAKEINEMEEYEEQIIEMVDDQGNKSYYLVDMIIPMEKNNFAVLVGVELDDKGNMKDVDEENMVISRVEFEDGEEVYVAPTDEEFEAVRDAYEKMMEEWDEEEE
ncbi:MAG: DUF1292 domain-containing protein [Phascolarctobacterium sp.]|nr:DUF1292 domain-containing protein [Phascolarctobacterium sp.]